MWYNECVMKNYILFMEEKDMLKKYESPLIEVLMPIAKEDFCFLDPGTGDDGVNPETGEGASGNLE